VASKTDTTPVVKNMKESVIFLLFQVWDVKNEA
jgi:hypothetical protein